MHGLKQSIWDCSHYFLIGGMVDLGYQDEFLMVSVLVCALYIGHDLWWVMP